MICPDLGRILMNKIKISLLTVSNWVKIQSIKVICSKIHKNKDKYTQLHHININFTNIQMKRNNTINKIVSTSNN